MPTPIVVIKTTLSMSQATILQWMKKVGDRVLIDETLLELETDKAVVEVPAMANGILLQILRDTGEVDVDEVIGWIGAEGEEIAVEPPKTVSTDGDSLVEDPSKPAMTLVPLPQAVTPAARRRAKELGLSLAEIAGTGPKGRVTEADVERSAVTVEAPPVKVLQARGSLVKHLTEAWQTVPHIHIMRIMDMDYVSNWKKQSFLDGAHFSITDVLLWTTAKTLTKFPEMIPSTINVPTDGLALAFAVNTVAGVVAPVIHGADRMSLIALAEQRRHLTSLAQTRRLKSEHLTGGCFTVTNLGMFDVDVFAPIINTPQIAILAIGKNRDVPVVRAGELGIGRRMWANLAVDHRYVDGARAAEFLSAWQNEMDQLPEAK